MAVVARQRKRGVVYQVCTHWQGHTYWETSGADKREAQRLDARRKREVKAGTYAPELSAAVTARSYLEGWFAKRTAKANVSDWGAVKRHVYPKEWFARARLDDLKPRHFQRLIEEITATSGLSPKSVHNIYGTLRAAFRQAVRMRIIESDPCQIHPGTVSKKGAEREIYATREMARLVAPDLVGTRQAVWNALAFFTGMRMGEICGLTWEEWDRVAPTLSSLAVRAQYDGAVLKTDRPRRVPVHPALHSVLLDWWGRGFEIHYLRRPRLSDPIVPYPTDAGLHVANKSAAYKLWRHSCDAAEVRNRSAHSTRHTFITLARRSGRSDVVERITHNAGGDMIDQYTHFEWEPLCRVILEFPGDFAPGFVSDLAPLDLVPMMAPAPGLEPGTRRLTVACSAN